MLTKDQFEEKLFQQVGFLNGNGKEPSSNFLVWFLVNYYRLDEIEAAISVCDHTNDKGIDGIYVDHDTQEVMLFQAKYRQGFNVGEGDTALRQFLGSSQWIQPENLPLLNNAIASQELKDMVRNLAIAELLEQGYELKLCFVTTGTFDRNAKDFIPTTGSLAEYWDCNRLYESFTFSGDDDLVFGKFTFHPTEKIVKNEYRDDAFAYLFTARAKELVTLDGIVDMSLFSKNVRYGLGRTNVNKAIRDTIQNSAKHKNFVLFHNGITFVAHRVDVDEEGGTITLTNYSIVNGCQSTLTLFENKDFLTNGLQIAIKVVETGENTRLAEEITFFANYQNPINPADLHSRDKFQLDLKEQFNLEFGGTISYNIKRGEKTDAPVQIENRFAAQMLRSFFNKSPFDAHLKSSLFSDRYNEVFTRHVDAYSIFLLQELFDIIELSINEIQNETVRSYLPTRFFILLLVREVMEEDDAGREFLISQKTALVKYASTYLLAFNKLVRILIIQMNASLQNRDQGDGYIDYKNILRNSTEVRKLASEVIAGYKTLLIHNPENRLSSLIQDA